MPVALAYALCRLSQAQLFLIKFLMKKRFAKGNRGRYAEERNKMTDGWIDSGKKKRRFATAR